MDVDFANLSRYRHLSSSNRHDGVSGPEFVFFFALHDFFCFVFRFYFLVFVDSSSVDGQGTFLGGWKSAIVARRELP